jgi:hypothetical protein
VIGLYPPGEEAKADYRRWVEAGRPETFIEGSTNS